MLIRVFTKILIVVLALLLSAYVVEGITVSSIYIAFMVAVLLGLINIFVRPILLLLSLPLTILTLGLFVFILNALLFWFVSTFVEGFVVEGFVSALLGTIIVSITSAVLNRFIR